MNEGREIQSKIQAFALDRCRLNAQNLVLDLFKY